MSTLLRTGVQLMFLVSPRSAGLFFLGMMKTASIFHTSGHVLDSIAVLKISESGTDSHFECLVS